ncbi:uncharacterized protein LOC135221645 [Macrobrachium nipponense]|uniref:uncharacterized protein LOC135221645 n=1 Tax=Macrobrachium nipponense TaxID=159736 RepID=UPI0030C891B5
MKNLKLPTIVLIAMHCATGIHGYQAESCFLYQTGNNTVTPEYQLKADQVNYVTINRLFSQTQTTTIVNERGECLLQLMNSTSSSTNDGCMPLPYRGDYTALEFRKGEDGVLFVNEESENEIRLNVTASSLRVMSSQRVNVAFDCPGNGIKMEYYFTLVAVCGILTLCSFIRNKGKQQRRQHTALTNSLSETNAAEPGIVGREGNGQGAAYDNIALL